MPDESPRFRTARPDDAPAVAALHADSWRRHYRGAYADSFLDGNVAEYLTRMWTERLAAQEGTHTVLADRGGEIMGMAHTMLDKDPEWGALVDNLHVRFALKRQGIGARLMALTARAVLDRSSSGLHVWVLTQNSAARAFYAARGGEPVESADVPPPGGDPARLNGKPTMVRYAWRDPSTLLT